MSGHTLTPFSNASRVARGIAVAALVGTIGLVASPRAGIAQEAGSDNLDEIVVTARKRDESLLNVPVAISVVTNTELNRFDATDLESIGQLVPQVIIARSGAVGSGASFSIRGVGSSPLDVGVDQTVSLNIDGLQLSRGRLMIQSFFDIDHVEVLEGPQALFFGKNSPGGVISLSSVDPGSTVEGYAQGGYEFRAQERFLEGAVSTPVTDTLSARIAVRASKMDGWETNEAGPLSVPGDPYQNPGDLGALTPASREFLGRLTLVWKPAPGLEAKLKVFADQYNDNSGDGGGVENKCSSTQPGNFNILLGEYVVDPYADCSLNGRNSWTGVTPAEARLIPGSRGGQPFTDYSSFLTSLAVSYDLSNVNFTSISGYWRYDNHQFVNSGFTDASLIYCHCMDDTYNFSEELRALTHWEAPVNFLVGGYFENGARVSGGGSDITYVGPDPVSGNLDNWQIQNQVQLSSFSAFAQAIYNILPNLELAGGARYSQDFRRLSVVDTFVNANFAPLGVVRNQGSGIYGDVDDHNVSPEATLTWHPTQSSTIYGALKTGYKSGGFSNPQLISAGTTAQSLAFGPEKARGGEVGVKMAVLDRRLTINATAYRYTFSGLQLTSFDPTQLTFNIRNVAASRTTGGEFETQFAMNRLLTLRGSIAYNHARYVDYPDAPCFAGQSASQGCVNSVQTLTGSAMVRAPAWNLIGGADFDYPVGNGLGVGASLDADYTSGYWLIENDNPEGWQGGFARLNAGLRLHKQDNSWEVAFIGKNLTNKWYGVAAFETALSMPDQLAVNVGRPLEALLRVTVRF